MIFFEITGLILMALCYNILGKNDPKNYKMNNYFKTLNKED